MANPFYVPGEQRAAQVRALFAGVASRYDLINDVQSFGLHRYWKARLVQLARTQAGHRVLDICCGTGDLCLAFAKHGVASIGVDFTEQMLKIAFEKKSKIQNPKSKIRDLQFTQGDALRLPFRNDVFDAVTVGYGLRNLSEWETGISEMQRVAKPGGRLLVLDFGKPDNVLWRWVYFAYLRLFVPMLGKVFCGDSQAYSYIIESLKHYPAQQGVAAKMGELGLNRVRIINLLGGAMSINYGEKQ